jgi:hypothetical protein
VGERATVSSPNPFDCFIKKTVFTEENLPELRKKLNLLRENTDSKSRFPLPLPIQFIPDDKLWNFHK